MRTIASIYYIGQIVASVITFIIPLGYAVRGIVNGCPAFIIICCMMIVAVAFRLMLIPSIKEYKKHKETK